MPVARPLLLPLAPLTPSFLSRLGLCFDTREVSKASLTPQRADGLALWDDFRFVIRERVAGWIEVLLSRSPGG